MKKGMSRKPIPLYMVDVMNKYIATGRVVQVYPFAGKIALNGFPGIPYNDAFDKMAAVVAYEENPGMFKQQGAV